MCCQSYKVFRKRPWRFCTLQIHKQESSYVHGGDELKYIYTINENNITERMCRSNTAIAGKETRAKLTGKAFVNCLNTLRLEQYKWHELVDFAKTEKIVYEKFKAALHGANVQQVARI